MGAICAADSAKPTNSVYRYHGYELRELPVLPGDASTVASAVPRRAAGPGFRHDARLSAEGVPGDSGPVRRGRRKPGWLAA